MSGVTPGNATVTHLAFIRGTAAEIAAVDGSPGRAWNVGEPVWDITNNILWVATSASEVVPIGPATNLPLTDYVHKINPNTISGANIFLGQTDLRGPTYLGARLNGLSTDYFPAISDQSGGGTLLPPTDNSTRLATTEWVQQLVINLPGDVARRGTPNTFTQANEFTGSVTVPTAPTTGPYDGRAASTLFVQQYINQLGGLWARLNGSNVFTAGIHDFTATEVLRGPTPVGTWATSATTDPTVPTIGWLKLNLPTGSSLLSSNNIWLGSNSYSQIPTIGPAVPVGDNSNRIPTTSWVQLSIALAIAGAISSGVPVLSKSLIDPSTLDWTSGTVIINGVSVPVAAGSYNYVIPGVYYIKVDSAGVVNATPTTPELPPGHYLLGTVSVVSVGNDVEISTVINTPAPINYAIRNADNSFTRANTFTGDVRMGTTFPGDAPAFMSTNLGLDFNSIPRGNYILTGLNENNKSLATTEWVTSKLAGAGGGYFELNDAGNVSMRPSAGGPRCLDLTGNCLMAPHPNANDNSNNVPTTAWVQAYVSGIPIAPQLSPGDGLNVNYTSGMVKTPATSPCSGSRCINGECNIPSGSIPINPTTRYIYVRYADCQMVASDSPMPANHYHFLGDVLVEGSSPNWIVTIINAPTGNWAPINSPNFVGNPTAPHPMPGDDDNSIPTTAWVRDTVESFVCPPAPSNRPRVVDGGGLNINVTAGEIVSPSATVPDCQISPLPNPLAVNASSTEYIWVRYIDCKVVASTFRPADGHGDIIGIVVSNGDDIVSITQVGAAIGSINTCLTGHYGVGFGGYLVYSPYEI
jgi:hypothetical protein